MGDRLHKTLTTKRHAALIDLLVTAREKAGLTQTELADRLGEYQSFVARLESGQRRIDVVELMTIAEALGQNPARIIEKLKQLPAG